MRRLEHCNIVKLKYFFYSSGDKVNFMRPFLQPNSEKRPHHESNRRMNEEEELKMDWMEGDCDSKLLLNGLIFWSYF